ncbi:MAG: hemolysin III family protein [Planctomycetota bacterium]|nr:hemolysin III family protein [Planctomycetota bacterium]
MDIRPYLGKEPISFATHFAGFIAALVGGVFLTVLSAHDSAKATGMVVYTLCQASVFLASACYHYFDWGEKWNLFLQKLDHSAIFLMISGSYVPPMMHFLDGTWRVTMLITLGVLAIAGIIMKMVWMGAPRWLSVGIYLGLGWIIVIPGHIILPQLTELPALLAWVATGGVIYTVGAFVYLFQRPNPWPEIFGYHEVWHLFVLGGAAAHFMFVLYLCDIPCPIF